MNLITQTERMVHLVALEDSNIWKPIDNSNYYISCYGEVYNSLTHKLLKGYDNKLGRQVTLSIMNAQKTYSIHRLVAQYFIPNPNQYACVLHKNGDVLDNSVDNLYWASWDEVNNRTIKQSIEKNKASIEKLLNDGYVYINYPGLQEESYLINQYGEVYSAKTNCFLKQKENKDGYYCVSINSKSISVASLVLYTFEGAPPTSMKDPTVNHIDSNRHNNYYKNLEWMEREENSSIRKNKGAGVLNHEAKLTNQEVINICELLTTTTLTTKEISKIFNVTPSTIVRILNKQGWLSITSQFDFSCRQLIRNFDGRMKIINTNLLEKETI